MGSQMIRLVRTGSSVMSSQVKPDLVIRASRPSKSPGVRVSMPRRTEPKLRADFFRYSKRAMSSSGPSAQGPGALRQAEDVVFLPALPAQRPLL
jgi:hypothetical protein